MASVSLVSYQGVQLQDLHTMPVDPVGIALGIVGLVGLFNAFIELLDTVASLQTHGEDYRVLVCRLEAEKILLLKWGEAAGLLPNLDSATTQRRYSEYLDDQRILKSVAETLSCLRLKFENANDLVKKYALQCRSTDEALVAYQSRNPRKILETVHTHQEWQSERLQRESSFTMKARWAIHDRAKLSELITEITQLNQILQRLIPTPGSTGVQHLAQVQIANVYDVEKPVILAGSLRSTHHLPSSVVSTQSSDSTNQHGTEETHQVYEWLEQATSDYTADYHSCYTFRSLSVKTRIGSNFSSYSSGYHPLEERMRDRMDKMFFFFFAYVIFSFILTMMNFLWHRSV